MKLKQILIFIISWFILGQVQVFAHPLDISVSVIDIDTPKNELHVSTYLHPFEVGFLLEEHNIKIQALQDAVNYKETIFEYIKKRVSIKNNSQDCHITSANIPPKDEFEIMGDGLEIQMEFSCPQKIRILEFTNTLFIEDFVLQTNKMVFFKDGNFEESIYEKVLTSKIYNDSFDFDDPGRNLNPDSDTDRDGLTDREENMYLTTNTLPDTDFDGYSDKEEVDNGWDPLNPEASPAQTQKVPINEAKDQRFEYLMSDGRNNDIQVIKNNSDNINESSLPAQNNIPVTSYQTTDDTPPVSGSTFFNTGYLKSSLNKIKSLLETDALLPKLLIFVLVYILGMLHSLQTGHGKTILVSYLIEENKQMPDAVRFCSYLTVTHLIDVVILAVFFKVFSLIGDVYQYITTIQKIGAWALLAISIFLLVRVVFPAKIKGSFKKGPVLGIIAGLAPCTVGWAIMITAISLDKLNWLIPLIITFGFGIFTTLIIFSFIILKIRNKLVFKTSLVRFSSLISAGLLFVIALFLIKSS